MTKVHCDKCDKVITLKETPNYNRITIDYGGHSTIAELDFCNECFEKFKEGLKKLIENEDKK